MLNAVKDLLAAGANDILIFNQIPLQAIPYSNRFNIPTLLTELTNLFNFDLRKSLEILQKNHPEASIYMFDIHSLITKIISSSSSPFINTVDKCWKIYNVTTVVELCSDPKKFVFIDNFHFSSTVHRFIADALQPLLSLSYEQDTPDLYIHSF
jgi:phospholipase/lecithinase/hemolysin